MAPYSTVIIALPALLVEGRGVVTWFHAQETLFAPLFVIFLSGVFAFCLNYSAFYAIRATSAVTFTVAGNLKVRLSPTLSIYSASVMLAWAYICLGKQCWQDILVIFYENLAMWICQKSKGYSWGFYSFFYKSWDKKFDNEQKNDMNIYVEALNFASGLIKLIILGSAAKTNNPIQWSMRHDHLA